MAKGLECPNCHKLTLHNKDGDLECSSCGYTAVLPNFDGARPGKGYKCPYCKTWTIFSGTCTKCGFTETQH
ncbi:MAG: hypothetical protein J6J11_09535 [Treponema sp.]|nr:hypothetical protein [Treponema sp.]